MQVTTQLIASLQSTRAETLKYFDLGEEDLNRSYAPGKWSNRFILHHLADAETVLNDRIRRVLCEPRQVLWAFNQDAWAKGLNYSEMPLELSRQIYNAVRAGIIHLARVHCQSNGDLEFVHSETGVRTLRMEFDKVAAHNQHHLEQIKTALRG
jgi:hypothetical protein